MKSKVVLALRLLLGAVFCYAAWTKLRQPWLVFAMSIDAYRMLPSWAVFGVARTLPWFELGIGILLLAGWLLRWSAVATTLLLVVFYAAMLHAWGVGGGIDCGCFGVGEAVSAVTLTRDGVLLASAIALAVLTLRAGSARSHQPAQG
jgi:uncharacterized membrane protein YphA (DoxX/SURF4 family)